MNFVFHGSIFINEQKQRRWKHTQSSFEQSQKYEDKPDEPKIKRRFTLPLQLEVVQKNARTISGPASVKQTIEFQHISYKCLQPIAFGRVLMAITFLDYHMFAKISWRENSEIEIAMTRFTSDTSGAGFHQISNSILYGPVWHCILSETCAVVTGDIPYYAITFLLRTNCRDKTLQEKAKWNTTSHFFNQYYKNILLENLKKCLQRQFKNRYRAAILTEFGEERSNCTDY